MSSGHEALDDVFNILDGCIKHTDKMHEILNKNPALRQEFQAMPVENICKAQDKTENLKNKDLKIKSENSHEIIPSIIKKRCLPSVTDEKPNTSLSQKKKILRIETKNNREIISPNTDTVIRCLLVKETIEESQNTKIVVQNNINSNKRNCSPSNRSLKKLKFDESHLCISYLNGKIIDPNLTKYEKFKKYTIFSDGGFDFKKTKYEDCIIRPTKESMNILFDNISFEITRPKIIKDVRRFIKETMKKHLRRKEFKIIYKGSNHPSTSTSKQHRKTTKIDDIIVLSSDEENDQMLIRPKSNNKSCSKVVMHPSKF